MLIELENTPIGDTSIMSIVDTLKLGGGNIDIEQNLNHEMTPKLRHAEARNGSCLIEPDDNTEHSRSMTELIGMHSGNGDGRTTITISRKGYVAYDCLVTIDMIGDLGQLIKMSWKGSPVELTLNP